MGTFATVFASWKGINKLGGRSHHLGASPLMYEGNPDRRAYTTVPTHTHTVYLQIGSGDGNRLL